MEPVEQVFLSVRSAEGFRTAEIVAATEFVRASDMTEIVGWFTEAEKNSIIRFDTVNIFFHPMPSGDYALGTIYPDQRGFFSFLQPPKSFFVRILIVPPRTLLEKGNNPLTLYEEFRRRRKIPLVSRAPKRLSPIQPLKTPSLFDHETLRALSDSPGPDSMAVLAQSLFDFECTFLHSGKRSVLTLLTGLFDLLPLRYRTELTFSTDLFFSVHTPFRIIGMSGRLRQAREQAKMLGIPFIALDRNDDEPAGAVKNSSLAPWPRFLGRLLESRNFAFLERQWKDEYDNAVSTFDEESPTTVEWNDLNGLAVSWTKAMAENDNSFLSDKTSRNLNEAFRCLDTVGELLPMIGEESRKWSEHLERVEGDLDMKSKNTGSPQEIVSGLPDRLPHLQDDLRKLNSLLTRAVFGDEIVLPEIRESWKTISLSADWNEREMICEEYLSLIRSILLATPERDRPRQVERSAVLLELLSLFLEKHS